MLRNDTVIDNLFRIECSMQLDYPIHFKEKESKVTFRELNKNFEEKIQNKIKSSLLRSG